MILAKTPNRLLYAFPLALALALGRPAAVHAQSVAGDNYGRIADESGAMLPGATVKLTGANIGGLSTVSGPTSLVLSADLFNVFNAATVVGRNAAYARVKPMPSDLARQ